MWHAHAELQKPSFRIATIYCLEKLCSYRKNTIVKTNPQASLAYAPINGKCNPPPIRDIWEISGGFDHCFYQHAYGGFDIGCGQ